MTTTSAALLHLNHWAAALGEHARTHGTQAARDLVDVSRTRPDPKRHPTVAAVWEHGMESILLASNTGAQDAEARVQAKFFMDRVWPDGDIPDPMLVALSAVASCPVLTDEEFAVLTAPIRHVLGAPEVIEG